jgi:hypothetical protein
METTSMFEFKRKPPPPNMACGGKSAFPLRFAFLPLPYVGIIQTGSKGISQPAQMRQRPQRMVVRL